MGGGSSLPYDAEVEYIASTGTSGFCIDTGISRPSTFTSVQIECQMQFISTSGRQIQGASNATYFGVNANKWEAAYKQYVGTADTDMHILSKRLEVANNESYFFAELKRLQQILERLKKGEEMFIILDEILKGTNSMDKQKGSFSLVKQLLRLRTNGIIATHDLLLGELKQHFPNEISNYCFEADIHNDELTFSYQLREGVAQNMNACFLMQKMGISIE